MTSIALGRLLSGEREQAERAAEAMAAQPVDLDLTNGAAPEVSPRRKTIRRAVTLKGPGTFLGRAVRTLVLEPCAEEGWWFKRSDLTDALPTLASVRNVWTTGDVVSNIVLRSGSPHNYVRMVEHLVALKLGLGIDDLTVRIDSGDPPLFERGSLDLVDAVEKAGLEEREEAARYVTVREAVSVATPGGSLLTVSPCPPGAPRLHLDCAIDFPNAIGRQRLRLPVTPELFRRGAFARTNTTYARKLYCQTVGRLLADVRNLGYTERNVLVAGRKRYINEPRLVEEGRSLEAVWHRACLDLLAALSLIDTGRFVGNVTSYKAGHTLDVNLVTLLYLHDLLQPFEAKQDKGAYSEGPR